jgi:hypothetical protein
MGRRDAVFHESITEPLRAAGRSHRYEKVPGEIIFQGRPALREGLGTARISVCFPSSMTHPQRSADLETVTHRYFESMASGCLLVGHAPQELCDMFGYNPVIESHPADPAGQLLEILAHLDRWAPLVVQNFKRLAEVGTWSVRSARIVQVLSQAS